MLAAMPPANYLARPRIRRLARAPTRRRPPQRLAPRAALAHRARHGQRSRISCKFPHHGTEEMRNNDSDAVIRHHMKRTQTQQFTDWTQNNPLLGSHRQLGHQPGRYARYDQAAREGVDENDHFAVHLLGTVHAIRTAGAAAQHAPVRMSRHQRNRTTLPAAACIWRC